MSIFKKFNTVFYRLLASYIVLIFLGISVVGVSSYVYFSKTFDNEINRLYNKIIKQYNDVIDDSIIEKVNQIYMDLIIETQKNDDLIFLFDYPITGNHEKILNTYNILRQTVTANKDILDSIYVYYKDNNIIISSQGYIYYDNDKGWINPISQLKLDWLERFNNTTKSNVWIETRTYNSGKSYSPESNKVTTLLRSYPYPSPVEKRKGCIAINVREDALYNVIKGLNMEEAATVLIIDENSNVISSAGQLISNKNVSSESYVKEINKLNQKSGNFTYKINGKMNQVCFAKSEYNSWIYITIVPLDLINRKTFNVKIALLTSCIIVILLGIVVSNIFTSRIYSPLRALKNKVWNITNLPINKKEDEYIVINKVINELSVRVNKFESTLNENRPLIKYNIINSILHKSSISSVFERARVAHMELNGDGYYVILFNLDKTFIDNISIENSSFIKYNMEDFIEQQSDSQVSCYAIEISDYLMAAILCIKWNKPGQNDGVNHIINQSISYAYDNFKLPVIAAVGNTVESIEDVYTSYNNACSALKYSFFKRDKKVLQFYETSSWDMTNDTLDDLLVEEFKKSVISNHKESIEHNMNKIMNEMKEKEFSYNYLRQKLIEIILLYTNLVKSIDTEAIKVIEKDIFEEYNNTVHIDAFFNNFISMACKVSDEIDRSSSTRNKMIIEKAKKYIIDNLNEDISLNTIAEYVSLSPNYFSKIFKDETGKNYIDFITARRMERAKELLLNINIKVKDVSIKVGYNNPTYFIKKFKEFYGKTPKNMKRKAL